MNPLFHLLPRYTPQVEYPTAVSIQTLCDWAGIDCRASGGGVNRKVSWDHGDALAIVADPGPMGAVRVTLTLPIHAHRQAVARQLLLAMAYGLFDGVARASVKGIDWARQFSLPDVKDPKA